MSIAITNLEVLQAQVLQLPAHQRAQLLDRVVASLDASPNANPARDAAWDALAAQRDAEIESGAVAEVPLAEVMARLRDELR